MDKADAEKEKRIEAYKKYQENERKKEHEKALKAFDEEINSDLLKKLEPTAKRQKIILIGEKYFGKDFNLDKIQEEVKIINEAEKRKALENLRSSEKSEYKELIRHAEYIGINKRLNMILVGYPELKAAVEEAEKATDRAFQAATGGADLRKNDWAIHGGIANAIAGPAAGLVTAQNVINNNSMIDQYNANTRDIGRWLYERNLSQLCRDKRELKKCEQEIDEAKTKLVSETADRDVFQSLQITDTQTIVSETGTVTITTAVKQKEKSCVFGDIPTVVDGTLKARLYKNNSLVGEALLVFPKYGIEYGKKTKLKGMCLELPQSDIPYEVKFEPYHLWYMEK